MSDYADTCACGNQRPLDIAFGVTHSADECTQTPASTSSDPMRSEGTCPPATVSPYRLQGALLGTEVVTETLTAYVNTGGTVEMLCPETDVSHGEAEAFAVALLAAIRADSGGAA